VNTASSTSNGVSINLNTSRIARTVLLCVIAVELVLVFLDLFVYYGPNANIPSARDLFNLARENSLGTWFSSTQTLAVAILLWLLRLRLKSVPGYSARRIAGWALLAAFFTYMAIDDAVAIHEHLGSTFEDLQAELDDGIPGPLGRWLEAYPSYTWQVVVGPLFAAMGLFLLVFLWRELKPAPLRWLVVLALGCFSLAVGMDYVEGIYGGYKRIIVATGWQYETIRHVSKVIEEFIEMLGTSLFLTAFLLHFGSVAGRISLSFTELDKS